jgi:hypothetical protein
MSFFKGKQGKDLIIIGVVGFIAYKFMNLTTGVGGNKPIQKQTI